MKVTKTSRGFGIATFTDVNGYECSIQDSSTADKRCLWLGVSNPDVKVMVPFTGWSKMTLPASSLIASRMHIDRKIAKQLIVLLQKFVDEGCIR